MNSGGIDSARPATAAIVRHAVFPVAGLGADFLPWSRPETAVDLVRTFVVSFDVLVLAAWGPCAIVIARLHW